MTLYARYARATTSFLKSFPSNYGPPADVRMGVETGVARDHSAHGPGCRSLLSRAGDHKAPGRGEAAPTDVTLPLPFRNAHLVSRPRTTSQTSEGHERVTGV
jgi:hypothetical protein